MSEPKKSFQIPIRYLLLPLFFALLFFAVYLMKYLGAFRPVVIAEKKAGPFHMIYKNHVGPYHKIVPVIEEVEKWAKSQGIDCKITFGEYLDNPATSEEARLRSRGGCVVETFPEVLPEGFEKQSLPEKNYVTAVFEGSPGIGPFKVYPKVGEYFEDQRLVRESETVIEMYVIHSQEAMTTTYYFPIKPKP